LVTFFIQRLQTFFFHVTFVYIFRPPDRYVRTALSFTDELSFFSFFLSFFLNTPRSTLSSRAVDGHQMYSEGSVVGKASLNDPEISPSPPLIFAGIKKCEMWRRFQHHSTLNHPRLKIQQAIRTLKQTCNAAMIAKFDDVGYTHP